MSGFLNLLSHGITTAGNVLTSNNQAEVDAERFEALTAQSVAASADRRAELFIIGGVVVALAYAFAGRRR